MSRRWPAILLATGCAAVLASPLLASASPVTPKWLVSRTAIDLVDGYVGNSTLATNAFDVPSTLETGSVAAGWVSQPTRSFDAYGPATTPGSFLYAIANHTIPAGTTYVLYDDESWSTTPGEEQQVPAAAMSLFVLTAHANGYKAILAPALDLTTKMSCHVAGEPAWENYLDSCDVPALVGAAAPDVYEIQAQTLDTDTSSTIGTVSGYWLNVPQQSSACPSCQPGGDPGVAVDYLRLLGYSG
jgi:hypothetical protein